MTAAGNKSRHPSPGLLLRKMDGELEATLDRRVARHLERCAVCRERERRMRAYSGDVSRAVGASLQATEVPELRRATARQAMRTAERRKGSRRWRLRGLAAAASVAGVLVLSWTVGPLRAWVWERGEENSERVTAPASLPGTVVGAEGSIVSFPAPGETFLLEIENAQGGGEVLLQALAVDRATAQITNTSGESMLVLPRGLRIENVPSSSASYRVTLPTSVRQVMLRIGGAAPSRMIEVGDAGWSAEIPVR